VSSLPPIPRLATARLTCPLCRDDLDSTERVSCAGSQTGYHAACLVEFGSCSTLGCSSFGLAPPPVPTRHQRHLSCSTCFVEATISELEPCPGCGEFVHASCASLRGCRSTGCAYDRPQRLGAARETSTRVSSPEPSKSLISADRLAAALALLIILGFVFAILEYDLPQEAVTLLLFMSLAGSTICVGAYDEFRALNDEAQ